MATWQWLRFSELSATQLYEILRMRQEVFTVEQDCAYQDADGKDQQAWHLVAWQLETDTPRLLAYLRLLLPGQRYPEPSIGRLLTTEPARGAGLARESMRRAMAQAEAEFPGWSIRISAQQYLEEFYRKLGFKPVSEPYDEDGIAHIEMLREPGS